MMIIYMELYGSSYGFLIDYVNYQFYVEGLIIQDQYVEKFNQVVIIFDVSKLMVSVNVDGSVNVGLMGSDFIGVVQKFIIYVGIMIWEVDDFKKNGFFME